MKEKQGTRKRAGGRGDIYTMQREIIIGFVLATRKEEEGRRGASGGQKSRETRQKDFSTAKDKPGAPSVTLRLQASQTRLECSQGVGRHSPR